VVAGFYDSVLSAGSSLLVKDGKARFLVPSLKFRVRNRERAKSQVTKHSDA